MNIRVASEHIFTPRHRRTENATYHFGETCDTQVEGKLQLENNLSKDVDIYSTNIEHRSVSGRKYFWNIVKTHSPFCRTSYRTKTNYNLNIIVP